MDYMNGLTDTFWDDFPAEDEVKLPTAATESPASCVRENQLASERVPGVRRTVLNDVPAHGKFAIVGLEHYGRGNSAIANNRGAYRGEKAHHEILVPNECRRQWSHCRSERKVHTETDLPTHNGSSTGDNP